MDRELADGIPQWKLRFEWDTPIVNGVFFSIFFIAMLDYGRYILCFSARHVTKNNDCSWVCPTSDPTQLGSPKAAKPKSPGRCSCRNCLDSHPKMWVDLITKIIVGASNRWSWTFKRSIMSVRLENCTFGPFWRFPAKTERSKPKLNVFPHHVVMPLNLD